MSNHVYKKIEIVGSSSVSIEDAIQTAITRASETLDNLNWFEVIETRGYIENGKVAYYQVTLKLGFTLKD
jgi:flavin-binding protein dodecin